MTNESQELTTNEEQLGQAWDTFADTLRTLGRDALASAPNDAERVDGLRFILRQLAYREEQFLEFPGGQRRNHATARRSVHPPHCSRCYAPV